MFNDEYHATCLYFILYIYIFYNLYENEKLWQCNNIFYLLHFNIYKILNIYHILFYLSFIYFCTCNIYNDNNINKKSFYITWNKNKIILKDVTLSINNIFNEQLKYKTKNIIALQETINWHEYNRIIDEKKVKILQEKLLPYIEKEPIVSMHNTNKCKRSQLPDENEWYQYGLFQEKRTRQDYLSIYFHIWIWFGFDGN